MPCFSDVNRVDVVVQGVPIVPPRNTESSHVCLWSRFRFSLDHALRRWGIIQIVTSLNQSIFDYSLMLKYWCHVCSWLSMLVGFCRLTAGFYHAMGDRSCPRQRWSWTWDAVGHPGHLVAACSVTGTAATTNEEAATVERLIFMNTPTTSPSWTHQPRRHHEHTNHQWGGCNSDK